MKATTYTLFLLVLKFSLIVIGANGQDVHEAKVKGVDGTYVDFPWAGGMNSCQYGTVDLDMDGVKDVVVFDRTGNRILPFLITGGAGNTHYQYVPRYVRNFPQISDWMILADYDLDGREDIFTYSPGYAGMKVYRNVSVSSLQFELKVSPFLTSFQGGGYTNILVTYADYPGIADIDGDGDLDILTFWGLGSFVEMHRNLSYEKYGTYDSLDYEKTGLCWGYFAESEESNALTLDTCVGKDVVLQPGMESLGKGWSPYDERLPHTGSTFQILDLDGDHAMDLLLGDVDYPQLMALHNAGSAESAFIDSYESNYPSYGRSVRLFSMPAAAYVDIDQDGFKDLLVSPFDPNPFIGENTFSSWFYRNIGTNEVPEFEFVTDNFLQARMIDVGAGCYPVFADYDGDGLPDLFIGNYGYWDSSYYDQNLILHTVQTSKLALYRNIGQANQPEFSFTTSDFARLSDLGLTGLMPAFGDLDGDGDLDMLSGYDEGKICLFENVAGQGQEMDLELVTMNFGNIDVGDFSAVQLFDLDRDGMQDMIIGERGGNLNYFKGNTGSGWIEFSLVTDFLGEVNVTDPDLSLYGYSVPFFFRDSDDNTLLVVGSEQGELFFYNGIDDHLQGAFHPSDTLGDLIGIADLVLDRGYRTSAAVMDLNHDAHPELIAGNFSGGLEYFSVSSPPPVSEIAAQENYPDILLYPNPAKDFTTLIIPDNYLGVEVTIALINLQGVVHYSETTLTRHSINIPLGGIPSGMFFVKMTSTQSGRKFVIFNKKLIIFN